MIGLFIHTLMRTYLRVGMHCFMDIRHVMKYYLLKLLKLLVIECAFYVTIYFEISLFGMYVSTNYFTPSV
jgi:hypothetical protein